ncbi:MAG TPA: DUF1800 domain-containing protein [Burkholderiales bacterium]|nr:DUF1800 domain-containing protein [Burkholderiales bacterium]
MLAEIENPSGADATATSLNVSPIDVTRVLAVAGTAALESCGGGGGSSSASGSAPVSAADASRFLGQASMGASRAQISRVQAIGYAAWLDEQFDMPSSGTRWDWLVANGFSDPSHKNDEAGFDSAAWIKLLTSPDTLRQRVTLALSEIFVAAIDGLIGGGWKQFGAAVYLDLLEANAFGNHRTLLQQISLSVPMGEFLTFRGSAKANATTGALPDENYARELMQLFTIGLVQLNPDGSPRLSGGNPIDTYGQADITGLARVFTGWDFDPAGLTGAAITATPDFMRRPMVQTGTRYEAGAKSFLGTTIASDTPAAQSLSLALDALFAHANTGPFLSRQLIQRLVTSNPSPAYVARVAAVFGNDGSGARGNLRAVVRALLLDDEARNPANAASTSFGKLREPMLRFAAWARAYGVTSPSGAWAIGNTSDPATRLAQSPLRSPSVFNFFRPGYVPPNSALGSASLEAPEFQIANESSVVGYVNYMQRAVAGNVADLTPDYSTLLPVADDANALVAEINLVLAANQLSASTTAALATALQSIPGGTDPNRLKRIHAALVLVLAAPEFIVQK